MYRYSWFSVDHDGNAQQRFNQDGTENAPSANVKEFHLLPNKQAYPHLQPFSLFLKKDQRLIYCMRRHFDNTSLNMDGAVEDMSSVVYVVGYEEDHEFAHFSSYAMLLPDGRIEWSSDYNHITRYERNLDVHPLAFYEEW